jgi:hypothetical protein
VKTEAQARQLLAMDTAQDKGSACHFQAVFGATSLNASL